MREPDSWNKHRPHTFYFKESVPFTLLRPCAGHKNTYYLIAIQSYSVKKEVAIGLKCDLYNYAKLYNKYPSIAMLM